MSVGMSLWAGHRRLSVCKQAYCSLTCSVFFANEMVFRKSRITVKSQASHAISWTKPFFKATRPESLGHVSEVWNTHEVAWEDSYRCISLLKSMQLSIKSCFTLQSTQLKAKYSSKIVERESCEPEFLLFLAPPLPWIRSVRACTLVCLACPERGAPVLVEHSFHTHNLNGQSGEEICFLKNTILTWTSSYRKHGLSTQGVEDKMMIWCIITSYDFSFGWLSGMLPLQFSICIPDGSLRERYAHRFACGVVSF